MGHQLSNFDGEVSNPCGGTGDTELNKQSAPTCSSRAAATKHLLSGTLLEMIKIMDSQNEVYTATLILYLIVCVWNCHETKGSQF